MRALAVLLALILSACAPAPEAIRFSILSNESSAATRPDWTPFLNDMRMGIDMRVEAYFGPNYSVLIEAMRFEQTHIGWFGNASALEAVDRSGAEVFATADRGGYFSLMIARADAGLTLDRVLACQGDVDFGAADPQSTSGTLSPHAFLWGPRRLDPQSCFATAKVANHEANILAVANGLVDVAIVDSAVFERVAARAPEVIGPLVTLWRSPRLPDDPLVWRANLDPALKGKIATFVLAYGRGDGEGAAAQRAVLAKLGLEGFSAANNSHLDSTRALKAWSRLIEARRKNDDAEIAEAEAAIAQFPVPATPDAAPAP